MTRIEFPHVKGGANWTLYNGPWQEYLEAGTYAPGHKFDHVITDPPFCERVHGIGLRRWSSVVNGAVDSELTFDAVEPAAIVAPLLDVCRRWFIAFCSIEAIGDYAHAAEAYPAGKAWVRGGVWIKPDGTPQFSGDRPAMWGESIAIMHPPGRKKWNGGGLPGIWRQNKTKSDGDRFHETQKPVALMMKLIEQFTDPGDLIFDPYSGSATTGIAALALGRRFVGCEIDPEYFRKSCERLKAFEEGGQGRAAFVAGQVALFGSID